MNKKDYFCSPMFGFADKHFKLFAHENDNFFNG